MTDNKTQEAVGSRADIEAKFGKDTPALEVVKGIDLTGKVAIVTVSALANPLQPRLSRSTLSPVQGAGSGQLFALCSISITCLNRNWSGDCARTGACEGARDFGGARRRHG